MKNEEKQINISDKVLNRIQSDNVKIRSRWFFIAEKLGLESGLLMAILIGIIILCFILYIMEQNGVFEFMEFGPSGWSVILENIPYDLVILAITFFIVASFIIKQFDFSYRKPFYLFSCGIIILIVISGTFLMWTGVSRTLFDKIAGVKFINNLYTKKITNVPQGERAVIGQVVEVGRNTILVKTPQGKLLQVKFTPDIKHSLDLRHGQGQVIKILGHKSDGTYGADLIRIMKTSKGRYFKKVSLPPAADSE